MPLVQRQREIRRRRRRVSKVRELKARLLTTQDSRIRKRILEKLQRLVPWEPIQDK